MTVAPNASNVYVDDTTDTSLYLTNDAVADAINTLAASGNISVSGAADPFPRPVGEPALMHGSGSPEGLVYAPQGSIYMRRDTGMAYCKTTGIHINTGWTLLLSTINNGINYRTTSAVTVSGTTTETNLLGGGITIFGDTLGTQGFLRLSTFFDFKQNSGGAATFQLKVKLGATTLVAAGANSFNNSEWASGWAAFGSTTAATAGFGNPLSGAAPQDAIQGAALSVDMTTGQALRLTAQFGTAAATITATPKVVLIEAL